MLFRWIPWKWLLRRTAERHGFLDPFSVLARLRQFSQPSEVAEPMELIRAGAVFHARGLINTKAIQHNLDWVWPYWVERQFNPGYHGFVPRAFSFSHINLTHRNWTAVGLPDGNQFAIVDPRGLLTPLPDGWSLDCWLIGENGRCLLPALSENTCQSVDRSGSPTIKTLIKENGLSLHLRARMELQEDRAVVRLDAHAEGMERDRLVVAIRPYNPEGIQFIDQIDIGGTIAAIKSESLCYLHLGERPEAIHMAHYADGDVLERVRQDGDADHVRCHVGMATAAFVWQLGSDGTKSVQIRIPRDQEEVAGPSPDTQRKKDFSHARTGDLPRPQTNRKQDSNVSSVQSGSDPADVKWQQARAACPEVRLPDSRFQELTEQAIQTLLLLSSGDIVPGPYTYNRFWFRDAVLMLNAVLALGQEERARAQIDRFATRQRVDGYFHSQTGEWDSNGQVLWILRRFHLISGRPLPEAWLRPAEKAVRWIHRKRRSGKRPPEAKGLLPAGFSAEHFGPNDFYYWDDFWALSGLRCAGDVFREHGWDKAAATAHEEASALADDLERSLSSAFSRRSALPAAPLRRMDAGAIGSLVADYPLQVYAADDQRIGATLNWLLENCLHKGGFFQDMIHSGINAYLTLDLAQSLLRRRDPRYRDLINTVAGFATEAGDWPEAIHPRTGGGCMGDGQHGWAAAEWFLAVRALFVREEPEELVLASGIFPEWLSKDRICSFGPTATSFGEIAVELSCVDDKLYCSVKGNLHRWPERIRLAPPGFQETLLHEVNNSVTLQRA